jgi:hypothetical protein
MIDTPDLILEHVIIHWIVLLTLHTIILTLYPSQRPSFAVFKTSSAPTLYHALNPLQFHPPA